MRGRFSVSGRRLRSRGSSRCGSTASAGALLALTVAFQGCVPREASHPLRVFAASSLAESFSAMETAFEAAHPDVNVELAFAGSQVLRFQIEQGAPADIFASANPLHTNALITRGHIRESRIFARNELALIVPEENPAGIESLHDLPRARRLVIGTDAVPVGRYARRMLRRVEAAGSGGFSSSVLARVASEENNARLVRAKVELGEADAAIVYRTDAAASGRVRTIEIPPAQNVAAEYSIAVVSATRSEGPAEKWVAFVLSPEGRRLLAGDGFQLYAPPPGALSSAGGRG